MSDTKKEKEISVPVSELIAKLQKKTFWNISAEQIRMLEVIEKICDSKYVINFVAAGDRRERFLDCITVRRYAESEPQREVRWSSFNDCLMETKTDEKYDCLLVSNANEISEAFKHGGKLNRIKLIWYDKFFVVKFKIDIRYDAAGNIDGFYLCVLRKCQLTENNTWRNREQRWINYKSAVESGWTTMTEYYDKKFNCWMILDFGNDNRFKPSRMFSFVKAELVEI